ncbi:MAG TPA: helix-turn-helix transcriptional regulator [Bacteriovoracaceae bacterium]|nr:helix-turn-helix transcriptional regulator [Bacteriovoracaceae bacterium]
MAPRSTYKVITDDVKAIRALRERRGLSVNKAAPLIGTNKSTLTALENGRINLSEEWINKIIKAYRFNMEVFNVLKKERPSSKDDLLNEISELASKLSYEKLVTIKQLLHGFQ